VNENIEHTDVFCAVTNDDEANIMACIQAKRLGARQVMALINRAAYVDLVQGSLIDVAISPQQATIGGILTHIRRGDIVKVHSLRHGAAEAIEMIAHGNRHSSAVVERKLSELELPKGAIIGAIIRDDEVLAVSDDLIIEAEDHIIIFVSDKKTLDAIEHLFQVNVNFFD
jgi:trk system potassium uptake protein TrkA